MTKTIWIVDDDREMAQAIQLLLDLLDYRSEVFSGARAAARRLLQGQKPDALILDINMPQVSGDEFLEFLRSKPPWKALPVIMLSSEDAEVQIDAVLAKGANAYLTKPVTLDELKETLKRVFQL